MAIQERTESGRKRRDEIELIRELEAKIKEVEARKERRRKRAESPVLKDFEKLKKQMARFAQICMDRQRGDIANSVLGFMNVLERQSREVRDTDFEDDDEGPSTASDLDDIND
ncbi:MAG: hypothetical protein R3F49_04220 [Planctomycetota bacterium]